MMMTETKSSHSSSRNIYYLLPLVLGPVILFGRHMIRGRAFFWGTSSLQFFPWWDYAWKTLLNGELPLWNPWSGMGAPLIANYQSAVFYPPYWLDGLVYILGGVEWMAWAHTLIVIFHLISAAVGTAMLLRNLHTSWFAAAAGGLSYGLGGYLVARAGFLSINAAASWFPWILLILYRMARSGKTRDHLKAGLLYGLLFLSGHAQTAWYIVLFSGAWMVFWSLQVQNGRNIYGIIRLLWFWMLTGLLGVMVAAVQLLPTAEYLLNSQRSAEIGFEAAMTYSYWPWRVLTIAAPDLFGSPAQGNYWGYGNYWEDAVYIGLLPLLLSLIAVIKMAVNGSTKESSRQSRSRRSLVYFLCAAIAVSFVFALGKNTPIFPLLYRNIPTFDLFQAPTRFMIWTQMSLAIIAGLAVDQWKRPIQRGLYWTRLAAAGSFAVSLGAGLTWLLVEDIRMTFISAAARAGLWGLLTALTALTLPAEERRGRRAVWRGAVLLIISADLLIAGWGLNPGVEKEFYRPRERTQQIEGRLYLPAELEYELKLEHFFRFDTFFPDRRWEELRELFLPNLHMLDDVESVNNFDPILPAHYQEWMELVGRSRGKAKGQLLDLMAAGTIVNQNQPGTDGIRELENSPAEKISWIPCSRVFSTDQEILDVLESGDFVPREEILLRDDDQKEGQCLQGAGVFKILEKNSSSLKLEVQADTPGWIFWSQTWYPGWTGRVDGERAVVLRANYLFQALPVQSGKHFVEFRYQPHVFRIGLLLTAAGALGIALGFRRADR